VSDAVTCNELIEFLDEYIAGELDLETSADFETHLAVCPSCRDYVATYRETIDLALGAAELEEELAHDAPPELLEAVKHVRR
jgi:anti-sigma factor RsiW